MGSQWKSLDLERIRVRAMQVRDPKLYEPDAIRAFYLNDIGALLTEVERLRASPMGSGGEGTEEPEDDGRHSQTKIRALRAEIERLTSDFRARAESGGGGLARAATRM